MVRSYQFSSGLIDVGTRGSTGRLQRKQRTTGEKMLDKKPRISQQQSVGSLFFCLHHMQRVKTDRVRQTQGDRDAIKKKRTNTKARRDEKKAITRLTSSFLPALHHYPTSGPLFDAAKLDLISCVVIS